MRYVVIGGGCYGTFYARQLIRAADAGAIPQPEIIVVDHNAAPRINAELDDLRIRITRREWDDFFDEYFANVDVDSTDQIVPPPFTPHLALAWLLRKLNTDTATAWRIEPFAGLPGTPFEHHHENGTLNASHADWMCPVHCIEPSTCPHTKGPRDWDMAVTVKTFAQSLMPRGQSIDVIHLFQCLHHTHGVGTYPAAAVARAYREIGALQPRPGKPVRALVGTVSRCHGTMHLLISEGGTDTVSPFDATSEQ